MKKSFVSLAEKMIAGRVGWLLSVLLLISGMLHAQTPKGVLPDGGVEDVDITVMTGITDVDINDHIVPWATNGTLTADPARQTEYARKFRNIISFYVNENNLTHVLPDFTASVDLVIEYKATPSDPVQTLNKTLTLEYKKGAGELSDVRQYITFEGAEYVKVTVQYNFPAAVGTLDYRDVLTLENTTYITRYFTISSTPFTLNQPLNIPSGTTLASGKDVLDASWSFPVNSGHNAVQLEWAWLEDELEANYYVSGSFTTASKEKLLRNNSSRVELGFTDTRFAIPMLYDGQGKVHYRVRGVSIQPSGTRVAGPWSSIQSISFEGHNNKLNWQSTSSFAEEGKHKTVIQYYDGSLRGRQTVTKDNVTGNTVTAESFYDAEGRAAVQVLPAPGIQQVIAYQKNLNKFNSPDAGIGAQLDNQDHSDFFDWQFSGSATPTLQKTTGSASQYYSDANPDQSGFNAHIPDAEGYPYTLTRYTPDGTGRVLSQSGIGAAMQMGTGHETKFYYGSPKQEELDALFGTEVGDKSHYFKNMVKDANGQMSVSYVDMHGRTIATALAGDAPGNLQPLDISNATYYPNQDHSSNLTVNLLDANSNSVKGNSIESVNSLLVPATTTYNFSYTLTPQSLSLEACEEPTTVCYECLYDLQISVIDESGETAAPLVVKNYSNLSVEFDSLCSTPTRLFQNLDNLSEPRTSTISFAVQLPPGSYSIRKTLTLNEAALEGLKANYIERSSCELDFQAIFDSVYTEVKAVTQCDNPPVNHQEASCTECQTALGTEAGFRTAYLDSIGHTGTVPASLESEIATAYQQAKATCELLCGTAALEVITKRELMLADMMPPYGQYANAYTNTTTMERKYNIFSTYTPSTQPFYRKPKINAATFGFYLDPFGNTDEQIHTTPAILPTMTEADFEQMFQDNWAEQLLPYHPEYGRLIFVETNLKPSYNWMHTFFAVPGYSQAQTEGYIFTSQASLAAEDPFFAIGSAASKKATMEQWLTVDYAGGRNLWQYAYYQAICQRTPGASGCTSPGTGDAPPFSTLSGADRDSVWSRFKNLYLQARTTLMDEYIAEQVPLSASDETDLIAQGYFLHFPRNKDQQVSQMGSNSEDPGSWSFWPPDPVSGEPNLPPNWGTAAQQDELYTDRCEANIGQWKLWFEQCPALSAHPNKTTIINSLTARMVEICRKGSNQANPFGASEVAPSTPLDGSFRSFEALINHVFDSLSIARTDVCNPFIIEYPKAYGKGTPVTEQYTTAIDSCHCELFEEIKEDAIKEGKNPAVLSSLNEYLWAQYGDTLSQDLFDALQHCGEIGDTVINNCDSVIVTITAPCRISDPCAGQGTVVLKMVDDQPVLAMAGGPIGNFCLEGYVWDPVLETCVPEGTSCPSGYVWDPLTEQCVPEIPTCPPGFVWDPILGECVLELELECEYRCFQGMECDTTVLTSIQLPTAVPLPAFIQCGSTGAARCISCTDIRALKTEFDLYFDSPYDGAPVTGSTNLSETEVAYNRNFARFLNYRTGFNFSWGDYMRAIDSSACNLSTGGLQTVICRDATLTDTTGVFVNADPCQATYDMAMHIAQQVYEQKLQWHLGEFERQYRAKCMAAGKDETFTVTYLPKEYHYTLYYYDQAGNLVKTVPPAGVRPDYSTVYLNDIKTKRANNQDRAALHEKTTQYRYNSLNQVVAQTSPDGGTGKFWYDRLGRLVVSQNAEQALHNQYSYTKYDNLGRITEVGQKTSGTVMTQTISKEESSLTSWLNGASVTDQLTITVYDEKYSPLSPDPAIAAGIDQQNLRNRVSYSLVKALSTDTWHTTATFYTYDIHGNVNQLLQDYRGVANLPAADRLKTVKYRYDLISGKVNEVAYQPGAADGFYHRYVYDAENRITDVETSRDGVHWEHEANYEYYKHGPLARTVLGKELQGVDYAYTVQGWLKGVNSSSLQPGKDMGKDGLNTGTPSVFGRDIYGYALHYFDNAGSEYDYKPIGLNNTFARPNNGAFKSLYNGNIGAMTVNNGGLKKGDPGTTNSLPLFYKYGYDQLNRIVSMQAYKGLNEATNVWTPVSIQDYAEGTTYDPDGNILTYGRNGAPEVGMPQKMDDLSYEYYTGNNRLRRVGDNSSLTGNYSEDIDDQADPNNYSYDAIGNLKTDVSEGITAINWTVYGKIASITKGGNTISYTYDVTGNRVTKTAAGKTTLYIRDASGNVMSVYEVPALNQIEQKELHLYGSSRLGMALKESRATVTDALATGFDPATTRTQRRGEKFFELSNHLSNVLTTITDKKLQQGKASPNENELDYFTADVASATDYYPFGMGMPGRRLDSDKYRYGFNGQEKDIATDSYDFGARVYDGRIGRWFGVDAYASKYPNISPYAFCINSPLQFKDVNGHWLVDKDGNIIFTDGEIFYEKSRDGKTLYEVRTFYFYTNDGQKVMAGRYRFKTDMANVKWDSEKNWPVIDVYTGQTVIEENSAENSSCHGNTLKLRATDAFDLYIPGKDWNDQDNVGKIYKNVSEFTPVDAKDVRPGDVAIFEDDNGNIQHSATVTKVKGGGKNVKLRSKDDRNEEKKNQTIDQIMENKNYKKFAGYYRHNGNVNTGENTVPSYPGLIDHDIIMERILQNVKDGKYPASSNSASPKADKEKSR